MLLPGTKYRYEEQHQEEPFDFNYKGHKVIASVIKIMVIHMATGDTLYVTSIKYKVLIKGNLLTGNNVDVSEDGFIDEDKIIEHISEAFDGSDYRQYF